jgi:hypothetical protein
MIEDSVDARAVQYPAGTPRVAYMPLPPWQSHT